MIRLSPVLGTLCLFFIALTPSFAQTFSEKIDLTDPGQQQVIITKRGDRMVGRIEKIEGTTVFFIMRTGSTVQYAFSEIEWVGLPDERRAQPKKMRDPDQPKLRIEPELNGCENLLVSPTAFNFKKGACEYRNLQVIVNTVDGGLSDHFSVGGGIIVPFLFLMRFKGTLDYNEWLHLGAGTTTFIPLIDLGDSPAFTHLYGVVTMGKPKAHLNATVGYGFSWGENVVDEPGGVKTIPLLTSFGGSIVVADRLRFMVDIAYLTGNDLDDVLPSFCIGWIGRTSRFELGLFSIIGQDSFALPVLGYAKRF